jgi:hypothetical protein
MPNEKDSSLFNPFLSDSYLSDVSRQMPVFTHLLTLRLPSDSKIRGNQRHLACSEAFASLPSLLQRGLL